MEKVGGSYGWIEIVLFAAVAFGVGFYQLWSVNREIRADRERKKEREEREGSAAAGHTVGEHELDGR